MKNILKKVKGDIAKQVSPRSIHNVFYNSKVTIKILELSVEFVAWTRVMDSEYNLGDEFDAGFNFLKDYSSELLAECKGTYPMELMNMS